MSPLIDVGGGSQRFVMPENTSIGRDYEELLNPRLRLPPAEPFEPTGFQTYALSQDLGNAFAGVHYFRFDLTEGRGQWRQRGYFERHYADYSDQDMVFDGPETGRHPFLMGSDTSPDPNAVAGLSRLMGTTFLGVPVMVASETATSWSVFRDDGTYDPAITAVTGYTRPSAGTTHQSTVKNIDVNGSETLWIGWMIGGGPFALEALSDLANPPTRTIIGAEDFVFGICQTLVDGKSVQVYGGVTGDFRIRVLNTDVALGAMTQQDRVKMPIGGYTVGLVNINPNPEVWYCIPKYSAGYFGVHSNFRGKLVRVDQRAFTAYDVDTSLSWVYFATTGRFGCFYCDRRSHYYMTRGADVPVVPEADRPLSNSNISRLCMGHWSKDDKFFWLEHEIDQTSGNVAQMVIYQYDVFQNRAFPVSKKLALSAANSRALIGADLPWSVTNDNLITYADGAWRFQYQPPRGELGYGKRGTDGAAATAGREYEVSSFRTSPVMVSKKFPRAIYSVLRVIGPPRANLRTGSGAESGMDYANARTEVAITNTPTAHFNGAASFEGRSVFPNPDNDSWMAEMQITETSYRDTGGSNATRRTPNARPITVEGLIVEDGFKLPSEEQRKALMNMLEDA